MTRTYNFKQLYAIIKKLNASGANITKEDLVREFTSGRTTSASEMQPNEWRNMIGALNGKIKTSAPVPRPETSPLQKMRGRLLVIFHELASKKPEVWGKHIGDNGKANVPEIEDCLMRIGCFKKPQLNDYNKKELAALISQFDNILIKEYGKGKS
jgi:hypothetical protein